MNMENKLIKGVFFTSALAAMSEIEDSLEAYLRGYDLNDEDVEDYIKSRCPDEDTASRIREFKYVPGNDRCYSSKTVDKLEECVRLLRLAGIYASHIDRLLAGEEDEQGFLTSLAVELKGGEGTVIGKALRIGNNDTDNFGKAQCGKQHSQRPWSHVEERRLF